MDPETWNKIWAQLGERRHPRVLSLAQIHGLQVEHKQFRSRKEVTDTKVSEQYDEHQSSTLGDTKSTKCGLDEGENSEDDDGGREGGSARV